MSVVITIKSADYLYGTAPAAALVMRSDTVTDYSMYASDDPNTTLFTIGNDLYITNADTITTAVVPDKSISIIFKGEQVSTRNSMPYSNEGNHLIYGATISGVASRSTIADKSFMCVAGTLFDNNHNSSESGHGIIQLSNNGKSGYLSGATFSNNSAFGAGAVRLYGGNGVIENTKFYDNTAGTDGGGAVYIDCGTDYQSNTSQINYTLFSGNKTEANGGALYIKKGSLDITSSTFEKNSAALGGAIYAAAGAVNASGTFSGNKATSGGAIYLYAGTVSVSNSTFSGNESTDKGSIAYVGNGTLNFTNTKFTGNKNESTSGDSAGIYVNNNNGLVVIKNSLASGNYAQRGSFIQLKQGDATIIDSVVSGNSCGGYGAIYTYANNNALLTVSGSTFSNNVSNSQGGAIGNRQTHVEITNTLFKDNYAKTDGGAIYNSDGYTSSDGTKHYPSVITLDGVTFSGNTAKGNGGAMYLKPTASATIRNTIFATVNDTVYNDGTVNFSGNITLNASLFGNGTYTVADGTHFTVAKDVNMNGLDLSNAMITVDASTWTSGSLTVVKNVSGLGSYRVNGSKELTMSLVGGDLVVSQMTAASLGKDAEAAITGGGADLFTSGSAKTYIANKTTAAKTLLTTFTGGEVSNALVAGAYAKFVDTVAKVGNVELNIGGTADIAAKVYAGGYLYGNGAESATAQMTVKSVNITIDGGAVSTNLFGGAHAREYGNAQIETVNITVTNGSHGRICAGGWAEKDAVSSVTTANVTISGGTVDYLYGAGANANGKTYVGTTNITIENDAVVNTIFMGGRYGYSYVETVNLTFAGDDKALKRLSGVSSAGMDYADATVVELKTNVTADVIDYVDKFVINEGCTLTANDEFALGNRVEGGAEPGVTTFDFITDGLNEAWTAIAGIKDFTNAQFSINGIDGVWNDNVMAITSGEINYTITKDENAGTITLAQVTNA